MNTVVLFICFGTWTWTLRKYDWLWLVNKATHPIGWSLYALMKMAMILTLGVSCKICVYSSQYFNKKKHLLKVFSIVLSLQMCSVSSFTIPFLNCLYIFSGWKVMIKKLQIISWKCPFQVVFLVRCCHVKEIKRIIGDIHYTCIVR